MPFGDKNSPFRYTSDSAVSLAGATHYLQYIPYYCSTTGLSFLDTLDRVIQSVYVGPPDLSLT
jgi:hypothetical protein